jgi:hypothetical protein
MPEKPRIPKSKVAEGIILPEKEDPSLFFGIKLLPGLIREANKQNTVFSLQEHGSESFLFQIPSRPDLLFSHTFEQFGYKESEKRGRKIFDIHRVLNILFPNNFPKFLAIYISEEIKDKYPKDYAFSIIRKKVNGKVDRSTEARDIFKNIMYSFFINISSKSFSSYLDFAGDNLIIDEYGNIHYVDYVDFDLADEMVSNKEKVLEYMKSGNYSEIDIENVSNILNRILASK